MKIIMKGPHVHPAYLSSLTQILSEHSFYITGERKKDKLVLSDFTHFYPVSSNVKIEIPWEELIQDPNWVDNYDLFIGQTEGTEPKEMVKFKIPRVWRTFSVLEPDKINYLKGPVIFNSYSSRNFSLRICRRHEALVRNLGKYVCYDYKDPSIFTGWKGQDPKALIVTHNFKQRQLVGYELYQQLDKDLDIKIIDQGIPFKDLLKEYQKNRVFLELSEGGRFVTSTILEAAMVGMPIIATPVADFPVYVRPSVEGYLSDNPKKISEYIRLLREDYFLACDLGHNARQRALELADYSTIKSIWEDAIHESTKAGWWSIVGRKWK